MTMWNQTVTTKCWATGIVHSGRTDTDAETISSLTKAFGNDDLDEQTGSMI